MNVAGSGCIASISQLVSFIILTHEKYTTALSKGSMDLNLSREARSGNDWKIHSRLNIEVKKET
jgi:hypothetical protein